jgi:hypothetical protein
MISLEMAGKKLLICHVCLHSVVLLDKNVKTRNVSAYTTLKFTPFYFITCFDLYFGHHHIVTSQILLAYYLFT